MIQLTKTGTVLSDSPEDTAKLRRDFNSQHFIKLSSFVEPEILKGIQTRIEHAKFESMTHGHIGTELCLKDDPNVSVLHFLANTLKLYEFVERITDRRPIQCFFGRIYRMIPG